VTYPISGGALTCAYGVRGPWAAGYHPGRDYRARTPQPVLATADAVVQAVGWTWFYGPDYGLLVVLQTGNVRHLYAHLSREMVTLGERVMRGDRIGTSGNTGRTSGPHLHYEERVYRYGYWDHRRPQFDLQALPTMDVSKLRHAATTPDRYSGVSLYKRELIDALKDNGRRVALMGPGDEFGGAAAENTHRLQRLWYPRDDFRAGVPGGRLVKRLGNRRDAWRTVA
jgi:murein DD-endopeptidase MepM/ murein hydrolase activator NlpD